MSKTNIDILTGDFYKAISFKNGIVPDVNTLHSIFHGAGLMINNSFAEPILFTSESFVQALEAQIATTDLQQFMQRERYSQTEIFGKVAQRLSVYEYTFADYEVEQMPRGINFIQYIKIGGKWSITSMVWSDENENHQVPQEWLNKSLDS